MVLIMPFLALLAFSSFGITAPFGPEDTGRESFTASLRHKLRAEQVHTFEILCEKPTSTSRKYLNWIKYVTPYFARKDEALPSPGSLLTDDGKELSQKPLKNHSSQSQPIESTDLQAVGRTNFAPDYTSEELTHLEIPLERRQLDFMPAVPPKISHTDDGDDDVISTYIPPPKTDITPELIQQSLTIQPQHTATIGSVIPHFQDGRISFYVQLNGLVANTIVINATTSLPCNSIGTDPEPDLMLVPKYIRGGSSEVIIADCFVIAVNMMNPRIITYWVQKEDGSIYSLTGNNKVQDIDKIDTNAGVALSLLPLPVHTPVRRTSQKRFEMLALEHRQILPFECDSQCPFYFMDKIIGSNGSCGCTFNKRDEDLHAYRRQMAKPNAYTATMSPEACAAMTCIESGKAAVFNPFSLTCWCFSPPHIESNPSAWTKEGK